MYGQSGSGAIYRLLQREGMSLTPLALKRKSVEDDLVTSAEYEQLIKELEDVSPIESRGRIRNVTLIAMPIVSKICTAVGRGAKSIALLRALQHPIPRLWELQAEQERNAANLEEDLTLQDQIDDELEMEMPLHAELVHCHVAFEESPAEKEAIQVYKLDRVPPQVVQQLAAYKDWRLSPLNYQRTSNAVVDVTAEHDCSTVPCHCLSPPWRSSRPRLPLAGAAFPRVRRARTRHGTFTCHFWVGERRGDCTKVAGTYDRPLAHVFNPIQL